MKGICKQEGTPKTLFPEPDSPLTKTPKVSTPRKEPAKQKTAKAKVYQPTVRMTSAQARVHILPLGSIHLGQLPLLMTTQVEKYAINDLQRKSRQ